MPDPVYRVLVYAATGTNFAVGSSVVELENVKNIGYAKYLNDVPEAFFTLYQEDPKAATLRSYEGTGHVFILRNGEVVWRGLLGEHEANANDVIFYAYGYEGVLFWLLTEWNQTWTSKQIDVIVTALWNRAKTDLSYSQVGFVTTGTIQAPVTTSGGATPFVLPSYKAYYKRILFALKELAAISTSDTTNICYFEIAYTSTATDKAATFNFWKNRTTDRSIVWEYGVNVKDFQDRRPVLVSRNILKGVGSGARNQLYRSTVATSGGNRGYTAFGRHEEPIYIQWVRDSSDLDRVVKLRSARALREDVDVSLYMNNGGTPPLGASTAGYNLGDRVTVRIDCGVTQIDKLMLLVGMQTFAVRGHEVVIPLLQEKGGT